MGDSEMYDDDAESTSSYSPTYASYGGARWGGRFSPPPSPKKAEPILEYQLKFEEGFSGQGRKQIDLVFVLDCTGSMQKYINATRDHVVGICDMIRGEEGLGGQDDLRVAVVNYRDHPPQDHSYVYKTHPFSSDIPAVQQYLKGLTACGGGDGPEAVTAGMAACLTDLTWRREAAKMVVLIADAPPHGIGESGDQIKGGDPDGHDPLVVARTMAANGITLFMVACEETLSGYSRAVDFFQALCNMTSGVMLPLMTADMLAMTIVGSVLENMDMERLIGEIGTQVAQRIREKGETMQSVEEVAQELHERLLLRNEQTKQVHLPEVYIPSDNAKKNVQTWMSSALISDASPNILYVAGKRLTESFRKQNRETGFAYTPGGRLPPRRLMSPGTTVPSEAPPTPLSPGNRNPTSPSRGVTSSPGRKIIGDFKAFGGGSASGIGGSPKSLSVFGAPLLKTGPGGGMFGAPAPINGGMRGRAEVDDEDEEEEEGGAFRKDAISLDQARRIATQSIFRAGRLG
ncbi:uncharacterized protein MKK02DRAFT_37526 [Dioszegia hungarica]|uniref:VWFA domain-containing protein n=1 Tax=Dioszegia hungarica TaxID=4972 RepID=A0AA38H8B8_9TREE|nr:uncharacterized protein MKK02DRAFT_37526 [Dioszegia hungarica]KAI9634646.1 hypothetical protein MKK02DRAFT_37526 [Dioszegia hungarica]